MLDWRLEASDFSIWPVNSSPNKPAGGPLFFNWVLIGYLIEQYFCEKNIIIPFNSLEYQSTVTNKTNETYMYLDLLLVLVQLILILVLVSKSWSSELFERQALQSCGFSPQSRDVDCHLQIGKTTMILQSARQLGQWDGFHTSVLK